MEAGSQTILLPGKFQQSLFKLHKHDLIEPMGRGQQQFCTFKKIEDNKLWEGCSTFTGSWKSSQSDCSVYHACWSSWFHCLCKVLTSKDCTLLVFIKLLPSWDILHTTDKKHRSCQRRDWVEGRNENLTVYIMPGKIPFINSPGLGTKPHFTQNKKTCSV